MFLKELNYLSIALTGRVQLDVHLKRTSCSSLCQLDLQPRLQLQLQQNGDFRALGLACLGFGARIGDSSSNRHKAVSSCFGSAAKRRRSLCRFSNRGLAGAGAIPA